MTVASLRMTPSVILRNAPSVILRSVATKDLLLVIAFFLLGQSVWAQKQYINQLMLIGGNEGGFIEPYVELYQGEGWTFVDYNLNSGTDEQIIYLLYKTGSADDTLNPPITDFYIKSTSDKSDHPDMITHNNRNYYRITSIVGSNSFLDSYGDLNDGAGGKYIYLYYTTDAWDYPRGISGISFNSTSDGAVCGNGSAEPQDLNEGAHGDYIYMHYKYALTTDVIDVYTQDDFKPLDAACSDTIRFSLADDVVTTLSNINVVSNNVVIDLNGKSLLRCIQSGAGTDDGHVFKVIFNSTLTITDSSTGGTGTIATGDADKGGAFYVDADSNLIIEGGTIESCQADFGGAIYNLGRLTIKGGAIQNCTATRGWGQGIIYNNGNLTINGGTIQNNTAYYGGAIYNVYGWTTTINGGVIQNNNAIENNGYYTDDGVGGGILNYGILYINGGTIQGNSCDREGGGIWMTNDGGLFMKGNPVIRDNRIGSDANNVYVPNEHKVINVVGDLTEEARIGVSPETTDSRITNGLPGRGTKANFMLDTRYGYALVISDSGELAVGEAHTITVPDNVTVIGLIPTAANTYQEARGNEVTLSATSYSITSATYNDGSDHVIEPVQGVFSFTMPSHDVTVSVIWTANPSMDLTVHKGTVSGVTGYWATFYHGSLNYRLPAGAQAFTMDSEHHLYRVGTDGSIIPAGQAVVIIAEASALTGATAESGTLTLTHTDSTADIHGSNILRGGPATVTAGKVDSKTPYVFGVVNSVLGFHRYNFCDPLPANKAYYVE